MQREDAGTHELGAMWTELGARARAEGRRAEAAALRSVAQGSVDAADPVGVVSLLCREDASVRADALVTVGDGWSLAGRDVEAGAFYAAALADVPDHLFAKLGLARLRMPGPGYYELLGRLHDLLRPATYLEIGMGDGSSMALARPGTHAVGVDPVPRLCTPVAAECRIFPEPSERFFARDGLDEVFASGRPELVFIDGLHTFPAVLADLAGAEALAGPGTVVVLHDTLPLDEPTQRPDRIEAFYTGDVWKLLPCLAAERPDLDVFTVRTAPSGLTFVTGLDPTDTTLADRYDELVATYGSLAYDPATAPQGDLAADDWDAVVARLGR